MKWVVTKTMDVGSKHPVVARLMIQTTDLLQATDYTEDQRSALATIYYKELAPVLLECWRIRDEIAADVLKSMQSAGQDRNDPRVFHMHSVDRLEVRAENFLYQAKNYLRKTLLAWDWFYGSGFNEASAYILTGKETRSKMEDWAMTKFGDDDQRTTLIRAEQEWAVPLIRMRNALEHPGGKSGTVYMENVKIEGNVYTAPTWRRNDDAPTLIVPHMATMLESMLEMGEDIFAVNVRPHLGRMFDIYEIPPEDRDPQQPKRLRVDATPEFREMIAKSHAKFPPKAKADDQP